MPNGKKSRGQGSPLGEDMPKVQCSPRKVMDSCGPDPPHCRQGPESRAQEDGLVSPERKQRLLLTPTAPLPLTGVTSFQWREDGGQRDHLYLSKVIWPRLQSDRAGQIGRHLRTQ